MNKLYTGYFSIGDNIVRNSLYQGLTCEHEMWITTPITVEFVYSISQIRIYQ